MKRGLLRAIWGAFLLGLIGVGSAGAASLRADVLCKGSCVDLSVTVSDGVSSAVPGGATVYLVTVKNGGPSSVSSVSLTDVAPAPFKNVGFVPLSGAYNASTHLWSGLSLGSGRSATMLIGGTIDAAAVGTLVNTVTVAPPAGTVNTNPTNSASDTDTLVPVADLAVTLSDGVTSLVAGRSTTYTVTLRNNGLSTVGSAVVTDAVPASLTGVAFVPASGSYSPVTHAWTGLSLAPGHSVTMTVTGTVSPSATGTLVDSVTVAPPSGVTDPIGGNNTASDTDTLTAQADLSITDSDNTPSAAPGASTTYSVVVSNSGPSTATGATVTDALPAAISSDSWTGPNGTSGTGNLHASVTVPAGGSVTYTIVALISPSATGSLSNTATVAAPAGLVDGNAANNSATDTDTLTLTADLAITNTDGGTSATAGGTVTYTVTVTNNGPSAVTGATVADAIPTGISSFYWTGPGGSFGTQAINAVVTLGSGATITYTITAGVDPAATGTLTDIATVAAPAGLTDSNLSNNSATDTDAVNNPGVIVTGRQTLGNLVLCNLGVLTGFSGNPLGLQDLNGLTVRQFLAIAENRLGGGTGPDSYEGLDALAEAVEYSFLNGTPPNGFADDHLSTSASCQRINWQPGQLYTVEQSSLSSDPVARGVVEYAFDNSNAATFGELTVGDTTDPGGFKLDFENAGDVFNFIPTAGPPGALTGTFLDPSGNAALSSGLLSGDVLMVALDVEFSDSYAPRTCSPPGSANSGSIIAGVACPWDFGDMLSFGQVGWESERSLIDNNFSAVEHGVLQVGDPAKNHINFTSGDAIESFFPSGGPAAKLTGTYTNPAIGDTGTGLFGADIVALKLDVDYSDAGLLIPNASGVKFGDLTICGVTSLPGLTGMSVRDYLALANTVLAGESTTYTPADLQDFTDSLGAAFIDGLVSPTASELFNGPCPGGSIELP